MSNVKNGFQERLATWVVVSGIIVSGFCAITAIVVSKENAVVVKAAKDILTILLPVIGTWIGTVLAFHFGRENFEAGARQARLTLGQHLDAKAIELAIKIDKIKSMDVADDVAAKALTLDAIDRHLSAIGFSRTPIFTTGKLPLYVLHRQSLDTFLAKKARAAGASPAPLAGLTLADLLNDPDGQIVKNSFVVVPETATLAEAKSAMEATKFGQDVFITKTDKPDSPVLGWLTNNEIQRASTGLDAGGRVGGVLDAPCRRQGRWRRERAPGVPLLIPV